MLVAVILHIGCSTGNEDSSHNNSVSIALLFMVILIMIKKQLVGMRKYRSSNLADSSEVAANTPNCLLLRGNKWLLWGILIFALEIEAKVVTIVVKQIFCYVVLSQISRPTRTEVIMTVKSIISIQTVEITISSYMLYSR